MKNIIIILSFLQLLILGACSSKSINSDEKTEVEATNENDAIDIDNGQVILLGNERNFDEINSENKMFGGCKIAFYSGDKKKVFHLREKYDFDEYRLSRIALWSAKYKEFVLTQMNRFDVYNNIGRKLTINPEFKGIALKLSNGELLVLLSARENSGLIKRTIVTAEASPMFDAVIEGNEEQKETCLVQIYFQDARMAQWYILPVYHPTQKVTPKKHKSLPTTPINVTSLEKKDKVMLFPCSGKPEITCEPIKGGYSRILIKGAENGEDKEITIKGKYNYNQQPVYHSEIKAFTDKATGVAFLTEEGEYLILMQLPEDAASVKKIRTKYFIEYPEPKDRKYDCAICITVMFDNRHAEYYDLPVYLPQ